MRNLVCLVVALVVVLAPSARTQETIVGSETVVENAAGSEVVAAAEDKLKIAISLVEPDVVKIRKVREGLEDEVKYSGFDIELWEEIARRAGLDYEYNEVSFPECFTLLHEGEADVSISGITINQEREQKIDFSHSYMNAYLGILVKGEMKTPSRIFSMIDAIFSKAMLFALLAFIIGMRFFALPLWLVEKYCKESNIKTYGGATWCVWAVKTTVGFGDKYPVTAWGRRICVIAFFYGAITIGMIPAIIGSAMVVDQVRYIDSEIRSPEDLRGKNVATMANTTSVPVLEDLGANVVGFSTVEEACAKLLAEEVDAVVYDSPPLLYYSNNEGKGKVSLVGSPFEEQNYGFALQQGSVYRERVNQELLRIKEDGTYTRIYEKWFGR